MIKLFEEYNNWYKRVSDPIEYFNKLYILESNFFTQKEFDKINLLSRNLPGYYTCTLTRGNMIMIDTTTYLNRGTEVYRIDKLEDEYYFLNIYGVYTKHYLCDQFEGLIRCLEDILFL